MRYPLQDQHHVPHLLDHLPHEPLGQSLARSQSCITVGSHASYASKYVPRSGLRTGVRSSPTKVSMSASDHIRSMIWQVRSTSIEQFRGSQCVAVSAIARN